MSIPLFYRLQFGFSKNVYIVFGVFQSSILLLIENDDNKHDDNDDKDDD